MLECNPDQFPKLHLFARLGKSLVWLACYGSLVAACGLYQVNIGAPRIFQIIWFWDPANRLMITQRTAEPVSTCLLVLEICALLDGDTKPPRGRMQCPPATDLVQSNCYDIKVNCSGTRPTIKPCTCATTKMPAFWSDFTADYRLCKHIIYRAGAK